MSDDLPVGDRAGDHQAAEAPAVRVVFLNYSHVPPDVRAIQDSALPVGWTLKRIEGQPHEAALDLMRREAQGTQALLPDYDVDREILDALPELKIIQIFGVGYDNIDVRYAAERGIPVCNAPGLNAVAVAELTLGLALGVARKVSLLDAEIRAGRWPQYSYRSTSIELYDKIWGVVGFGNIGREVARRARAFGTRVIYFDVARPIARTEEEIGAEHVDLDTLLEQADVVSLHVTLTPQTRHMIDGPALRRMKPGAILVNTSRGSVVDTKALAEALAEGRLLGAGLDVLESEPPPPDNPLLGLRNVVFTPHTAAGTRDTIARVFRFCYVNMARFFTGQEPLNRVN